MKERGSNLFFNYSVDLSDNEIKKLKVSTHSPEKNSK